MRHTLAPEPQTSWFYKGYRAFFDGWQPNDCPVGDPSWSSEWQRGFAAAQQFPN